MTLALTIIAIWLGASAVAVGIPVGYVLLSNWRWERRQRRAMWRQVDGFLGKTRLPT